MPAAVASGSGVGAAKRGLTRTRVGSGGEGAGGAGGGLGGMDGWDGGVDGSEGVGQGTGGRGIRDAVVVGGVDTAADDEARTFFLGGRGSCVPRGWTPVRRGWLLARLRGLAGAGISVGPDASRDPDPGGPGILLRGRGLQARFRMEPRHDSTTSEDDPRLRHTGERATRN